MGTLSGYIDIILDGLSKKDRVMDDIIALNARQREVLTSEEYDMDSLDEILEEKSALIEQLNRLDEGFTSVYDRVREELPNHKSEYAEQITQMKLLITSISEKNVAIQSEEVRNNELAKKFFGNARRVAGNARRSNTMANSYYKSMKQIDSAPQFFDRQK